jgi:hypothetical protein
MSAISGSNASNTTAGGTIAPGSPADRHAEVADYVDAVREALGDLEPTVRDGLLEDLPEHLTEVAAADDTPLRTRLGPPATFAAELRSAAGVPGPADSPRASVAAGESLAEVMLALLRRADRATGRFSGYPTFRDLLVALRPGWWVLRGVGVVAALMTATRVMSPNYTRFSAFVVFVVLAVLGAGASCRLGRAAQRDDANWRATAAIVNAVSLVPVFYSWFTYLRPW